jgi:nucleotide-binding universal stress UspA family protein
MADRTGAASLRADPNSEEQQLMILVSYDGSEDAQAAIDRVARLMPGAAATVVTVWEPLMETVMRRGAVGVGIGMAGGFADGGETDAANERAALDSATEGADRATAAGLHAQPRTAVRHNGIANAILAVAREIDADLIVMGTRGRSGMTSFMLGSVSHALAQHADRAVMVVPSAALAAERRERVDQRRRPVRV